jgi:hypothetical protein
MTGCGQRPRETERASNTKEINVPADDEQRIGGSHAGSHVSGQLLGNRGYSALRGSALPDPAELRLGIDVGLPMLAVAPGPARALFMMLLTA